MPRYLNKWAGCALLALLLATAPHAKAQIQPASTTPLTLTLDEAIQIALVQNYAVRSARLNVDNANAQIREAWGQIMPQVSANSSYTRNVRQANPFSGSSAGNLFGSLGFIDWLAFNEQARTDSDPTTNAIAFGDFLARQQQGLDDAGIVIDASDNPFAVPNQFQNTISITQKVFDIRAFWGISGAEKFFQAQQEAGLNRQEQLLIQQVKQAFYGALLAEEQVRVIRASEGRTQVTLDEMAKQVRQGVQPKFQRLTAEVELANIETQRIQTENQAGTALDNLKMVLGMPQTQAVSLRGALDAPVSTDYLTVSASDAMTTALDRRPDLLQANIAVELQRLQARVEKAARYPTLDAFANFSYIGNVPDNRDFTVSDPNDPFRFSRGSNGFFSDSYWDQTIGVGFQLNWTLFNGFQTRYRIQQFQIATEQAKIQEEQLRESVRMEVEQARRDLRNAQQRITGQQRNVERAELNYTYVQTRLGEGVATQLEERQASDLLDQSRLNLLQAVFDYKVAEAAYEAALGLPPEATVSNTNITSN